jgi:hypothetical protein
VRRVVSASADHAGSVQLGGSEKPRVRLPVLRVDPELSYELRRHRRLFGSAQEAPFKEAIPRNRGECPTVRPCRFFCQHNTWVVSGLDQAGRRWVGTLEKPADLPSTQVVPTTDHNCALDWAEVAHANESVTPEMIAATLGISDRQARRYNADAIAALPSVLRAELEQDDDGAQQWREP